MDELRFDAAAKAFSEAISRRGSLGVLTVGLASVGGALLGWREAFAQAGVEETDPACEGKKAINHNRCRRARQCSRNRRCFCGETVNAQKRCVNVNTRCPRRDECDRNKDCAAGRVCVKVGGCCGGTRTACLKLCG